MNDLNFQKFQDIYQSLGIDTRKLGCVMLQLAAEIHCPTAVARYLYRSPDDEKFWIDGWVANKKAHCTLLYGLLQRPADHPSHVVEVLNGWHMPGKVELAEVGYFPSPYPDEDYWCLKANIVVCGELLEAHARLSFLPHINTFPLYIPHMTLGYVQCSAEQRDAIIKDLNRSLEGVRVRTAGIDLGRPS